MARSICRQYAFIDYATQVYLVLMGGLILVFHHDRVPGWPYLVGAHGLGILMVHWLTRWHGAQSRPPGWLDFVRHFYPMAFYVGFYREAAYVNQMFFDGFQDPFFIKLEAWIFGGQPSLSFMERLPQVWISEVFYAAYFSYYVMIFGIGIALFVQDRARFFHYLSVISFMFYVCYVIFAVLPVIGPPIFYLPEIGAGVLPAELRPDPFPVPFPASVQAGPFFQIMKLIYELFESPGAAFPSSHVAVGVGTLYFSYRYLRAIRRWHLVMVILLCFATVYCRYHYVVDVWAGLAAAGILLPLGNWMYQRFTPQPIEPRKSS
jgi:membrane-associated phospholipid phosphatase